MISADAAAFTLLAIITREFIYWAILFRAIYADEAYVSIAATMIGCGIGLMFSLIFISLCTPW